MRAKIDPYVDDLPEMDPIVFAEMTEYGWRGLSQQGEVLEVKSANGHQIAIPESVVVTHDGHPIGRRIVKHELTVDIDEYLVHFNHAVERYKQGRLGEALVEAEAAIYLANTKRAKFNYAMILLANGQWRSGFEAYWECEQELPFMRPQVKAALDAGLKPWCGEDIKGKKLLVMHAHGFGDTIMCLRFIEILSIMGADVILMVPKEIEPLVGAYPTTQELQECDFFCPILHLLYHLRVGPENVKHGPYIYAPGQRRSGRKKVGIAWSVGKPSLGDYPRTIELEELTKWLGNIEVHSLQKQGKEEAERFGVVTHDFKDFMQCASLMEEMDQIISVDTAALHLAGAIGHPHVFGLLSHWSSWRWIAPWYQNVKLCKQTSPGDWHSALIQAR